MRYLFAAAFVAAISASPVAAQTARSGGIGVGVTAGTLGIGPEVNFRSDNFGVRGSATFLGVSRSVESDGIDYDGKLKLRSFGVAADFYPGGGGFRISAGARISKNRVELFAAPGASTSVEVGDVTYTGAQIGTLSGEIRPNKLAPTLTLGYGGGKSRGVYFSADAGAMFQGKPKVRNLVASGPIASNASFQTQLAIEKAEIEDDIDNFKIYPILQLGLGYRF
jgi:hypothetical protein